ncbi:hypothetical protein KIN20_005285 [Parelaphostrongylus tenuis]|uniref:Uncharacterized protein n=1 Tax=Parelaphostrongylus tenuis TaxID=148309 RepID=A0AAD5QFS8_PARTN|nr:hypothetical protein KIN20_005285 [Parelaphostrongylus tenuis]
MPVTWMSLCRQYRNDSEFRGSLNFFISSFGVAVVSWYFGAVMLFMAFVICILTAYHCAKYFGQKAIYAVQATFLGLLNGTSIVFHVALENVAT